jgi:peptidoglycan/LPS O-acetylase OafA/YrhL
VGILTGLALIPVMFYTYNGAFGKSPDWLNITFFFISAAVSFLVETILFYKNKLRCKRARFAFLIICLIGVLFVVFTFATPQIPLFKDPLTGTYGIND